MIQRKLHAVASTLVLAPLAVAVVTPTALAVAAISCWTTSINARPSFDDLPDLLSAREAAAWLGLPVSSVYEQARRGAIDARKIGRRLLISKWRLAEQVGHEQDRVTP